MAMSVAVSVGSVSISGMGKTIVEVLMNNPIALWACVGCGVALLRRPGGSLLPIEIQNR